MEENIPEKFLYYPEKIPLGMPPPFWVKDSIEVWMRTSDNINIHGLWWGKPPERPVILFFHGNAQEVYSWSLVRKDLEKTSCRMLIIDYRGYGKSEGTPTEKGLYEDGRAAVDWLLKKGISPEEIVLFGKSLGGAVACEIAREREFLGLILESTFTSLSSVKRYLLPFAPEYEPPANSFNSIKKLAEITCPVLVIHGKLDTLIPFSEGEKLFKAAGQKGCFYPVEGAGHNDVSIVAGEEYGTFIRDWIEGILREKGFG